MDDVKPNRRYSQEPNCNSETIWTQNTQLRKNAFKFRYNLNDKKVDANGTTLNGNTIHGSEIAFFIIKIKMEISLYLCIMMLNSWPLRKPLYNVPSVHHYAHYPFSNFQQQCNVEIRITFLPIFLIYFILFQTFYYLLPPFSFLFHPKRIFQLFRSTLTYVRCWQLFGTIFFHFFPFFNFSWSNNISFIFNVDFIRFDVMKKPFSERFHRYQKSQWPDIQKNTFFFRKY